jgi:hypothetical protein
MPNSADGLRGQQRDAATKSEALVLADAICGALDIIDLFQHEGGVVLVANGELQVVHAGHLRTIVESLFATKSVVQREGRLEVNYPPVSPSEMSIRAMLTKEPRDGGLIGRLPILQIEQLRVAQPETVAPPEPVFIPGSREEAEYLTSKRVAARYANPGARTELESQRGAEVSARYARQQQQAAAATEPPIVVESYPIYAPPVEATETKDEVESA